MLDRLRAGGIGFDLDPSAPRLRLVWSVAPTPAGQAWLAPWEAWLINVAVGRLSGHAPAVCSECGELAIVPIVNTSGTRMGRASTGWARCRMSNGWHGARVRGGRHTATLKGCPGRMVIREVDFVGVARVKPPGVAQLKTWRRRQEAL